MPGVRIEFSQKPADLDEFMKQFPPYEKCGKDRWVWSSSLGTVVVTALEQTGGRFVILVQSDTRLHTPWERANRLGKRLISHYEEIIRTSEFD